MADFNTSWQRSAQHEGGWVKDPNDAGGETYRGIARVSHPEWAGWPVIDQRKKTPGLIKRYYTAADLDRLAGEFYKKIYWSGILGDTIKHQGLADAVLDHTFSGLPRAQRMLRHMLKNVYGVKNIADSGQITPEVTAELNKLPGDKVLKTWVDYRAAMFKYSAGQLPASDPRYNLFKTFNSRSDAERAAYGSRYVNQWLDRANSYALGPLAPVAELAKRASGSPLRTIIATASLMAVAGGVYYIFNNDAE